jgi:hypothetical protein
MHGSAPSPSQLGCGNPKQLSTQLPATQTRSGPWLTLLACLIVHACLERPLRDRSHGPPATLLIAAATGLSPALIWGANQRHPSAQTGRHARVRCHCALCSQPCAAPLSYASVCPGQKEQRAAGCCFAICVPNPSPSWTLAALSMETAASPGVWHIQCRPQSQDSLALSVPAAAAAAAGAHRCVCCGAATLADPNAPLPSAR